MFDYTVLQPTVADVTCAALALTLMMADIVTGFIAACIRHNRSSTKMRQGLGHKALMVCLIFVMYVIERMAAFGGFPVEVPTCVATCGYIAVMELLSVTENIGKAYPAFRKSPLYRILKGSADTSSDLAGNADSGAAKAQIKGVSQTVTLHISAEVSDNE